MTRSLRATTVSLALAATAALGLAACGSSSPSVPTPAATTSAAASPTDTASPTGSESPSDTASPTDTGSAAPTGDDNGVAELAAKEILAQMRTAVKTATSVQLAGEVPQSGSTIKIDMLLTSDGSDGTLTLSGQEVKLKCTSAYLYMQADADFWKSTAGSDAAAKLFVGKWVAFPSSSTQAQQFSSFCNLSSMVEQLITDPSGTVGKGEQKDIDGMPAIALESSGSSTGSSSGGLLWIATTGKPYPLRLEPKSGEGQLNWSEWDAPGAKVTPPPDADVVDFSDLTGATPSAS